MSRFILGILLNVLLSASLLAQQQAQEQSQAPKQEYAENYVFAEPEKRKLFLELTAELRCPKCQNQNIADSDASIAHDMRRKVYQLLNQGYTKEQVVDWMKQRYGDFVYYQPPLNAATVWLWLLPVAFVLVMLLVFVKRRKVQEHDNVEEKLAKAEALLKDD